MKETWIQTSPRVRAFAHPVENDFVQEFKPVIGLVGPDGSMPVPNESGSQREGRMCWKASIRRSGEHKDDLKFGNYKLGEIEGKKFNDVDGDGEFDQGSDRGLNNWNIRLYDAEWDNVEHDLTGRWRGTNGWYFFEGLTPGRYHVCEVLKDGWVQTYPQAMAQVAPLPPREGEEWELSSGDGNVALNHRLPMMDSIATRNRSGDDSEGEVCWTTWINRSGTYRPDLKFGNFKLGVIDGRKIEDKNGDGVLADDEPGLGGWTIQLWEKISATERKFREDTVTNERGYYKFENLEAGEYYVTEVLKDGWMQKYTAILESESLEIRSGLSIPISTSETLNWG